jgi:hypothetical protein
LKRELRDSLATFLVELVVYAVVVTGYFLLVLHLLGGWLADMVHHDRRWYAAAALGLIIGQGLLLEILTRALSNWLKRRVRMP